ncbi:hypothetical protein GOZ96_04655 [Agrobacterium vitis]|uniref:Uncharacterized protein n=1 Tax=Agrobacterium vitis TaxID=373 RepID=A0A7J4X5D0_AGRVI|nr:hypothetical protein [Agrobacterium vitis]KAA3527035.1 hypothetical protein DXT89_13960 [Agrobacterium vitis]MUZ95879.1 hypothetical protein [Agrobacterium vitis]
MATQEEKIGAVQVAVSLFADVETGIEQLEEKFTQLIQAINDCVAVGVGKQGEGIKITSALKGISGKIAAQLGEVIAVHEKCTVIAKREDCDVVLPTAYAVSSDTVTTLGGGDR